MDPPVPGRAMSCVCLVNIPMYTLQIVGYSITLLVANHRLYERRAESSECSVTQYQVSIFTLKSSGSTYTFIRSHVNDYDYYYCPNEAAAEQKAANYIMIG